MSLSLSDLDDCGTLLSAEYEFQLHDKILTPEVDEPVADIQLQEKCALPELVDIPPLPEPKTLNKECEQECEKWWFSLTKQQQRDVEQHLAEKEKQRSRLAPSTHRAAKRSSSFSSSASSFFSSYSSVPSSSTMLRRSSSLASLLFASTSSPSKTSASPSTVSPSKSSSSPSKTSASPSSAYSPSKTYSSPTKPSSSLHLTEQQYTWALLHLSSPARLEEKQMEAWWQSLTANKRQHIEKFIADTNSAAPNHTDRALRACTKKFALSESQYYYVLFRLNSGEQEEKEECRGELQCEPDLSGKHFFKNGHTFHASTTVNLLGPANVCVVRRADRQKLHLVRSGNVGIRVDQPGPFTVWLRDFRLNLNNTKAQFRIEAEMCGKVYATGWCTVHPRPPPSRKLAAQGAESSSEGTPTRRRKRPPEEPTAPISDFDCPRLGRRKQSALQFLSNVALDQIDRT